MAKEIFVTRSSMPPFDEYMEMIRPLWDTHWLTNMGAYHRKLEEQLSEYLSVPQVSLMVNGHMALELAIQAMEFEAGSEVITTPFTFVSTTHAILRNRLHPVFCDVKEDFTIDEDKIEELITEKTVAIIPVHVYGNICNVERIQEIADRHHLKVIYDAAHAFGETYKGRGVASFGDVSVFSFHATKVFHTIEGGAVCCQRDDIYQKLYNLKNFGIRSEEEVVSVGANAKMNEFAAAMGICNLRHIGEEIGKRKLVVALYRELLQGIEGIHMSAYGEDVVPNYAYFPVCFASREIRDAVYDALGREGIHARKYFYPLTSDQICFGERYRSVHLERARSYSERVLVLPLFADMAPQDVEQIAEVMKGALKQYG